MEKVYRSDIIRAIIGYFIVVLCVFYGKLLLAPNQLIFGDDIHRSYYFFSQYLVQSLLSGTVPWWNPYLFSGTPFLANPITNAFYPINWLFLLFPSSYVYIWGFMFHLIIAMSGMYLLLKEEAGRDRKIAAWGGGLIFGLSSFFASRIYAGHPDVIAAASFLPFVLYLIRQSILKDDFKMTVFAGLIFSLQLFSGYQSMSLLTMEAAGMYVVLYSLQTRRLRALLTFILVIGIGVGIASVILLPIQQFVSLSIRTFDKPYSWNSYGSLNFHELLQVVQPFLFGDQYTYRGGPPNYWEHAVYIGRFGIVFAVIGFFWLLRSKKKSIVALTGVFVILFGLWVSLGRNAIVDLQKILWQTIPLYHYLRIPSRHVLLVVFGLSILSGIGLSRMRSRVFQYFCIISILIEMILYARHFIVLKDVPEIRHDQALITMLQNDTTLYRILPNFGVWVSPRDSLDFDSAMKYTFFSTTGYDSTLLRNYYEFIDAVNSTSVPSIMEHDVQVPYLNIFSKYTNFLNIKYIMVPLGFDPNGGATSKRFQRIREDFIRDYRLYKNADVLPRFFLVRDIKKFIDRDAAAQALREGSIDLSKSIALTNPDASKLILDDSCSDETNLGIVEVKRYSINSIELYVRSSCDAVLSTSEVYYPGWEAFIDKKKTPIVESNIAFRAVFVPKGEHIIILRYLPRIFFSGAVISVMTLTACIHLLFLRKKS